MTELLDAMVRARLPWVSPLLRTWYDEERLARQLADALAPEAARVDDPAFGKDYRATVGTGVGEDLDWANRRLDLPGGGWAVTGIRFRGRVVERPFVDVVATTEPPSAGGLAAVADAVVGQYEEFHPLCLRVDAPDTAGLVRSLDADDRFGTSTIDMHVVAGLVSELRAHEHVPAYHVVRLGPGDAGVLAARVAAVYGDLGASNAALGEWATPEGESTLAACAEEGLLFEVLVEGRAAGVVAAVREDDHGMSGFCVQELVLDAAHQGRRLAPGVLQRLVDELPAHDGDVLWGTIHPDNAPSLRNAQSIGRRAVGGYVWVTPAGLPGMR